MRRATNGHSRVSLSERRILRGEALAAFHGALVTANGRDAFPVSRAVGQALGHAEDIRSIHEQRLGSRFAQRIRGAARRFEARNRAVQKAVALHGYTRDGRKNPARLFLHVFGRLPKGPVDYIVHGGLIVFYVPHTERNIANKALAAQIFYEHHAIKPTELHNAVVALTGPNWEKAATNIPHEELHGFFNLEGHHGNTRSGTVADQLSALVGRKFTPSNVRRFRKLSRQFIHEYLLKDEILACFTAPKEWVIPMRQVTSPMLLPWRDFFLQDSHRAWGPVIRDAFDSRRVVGLTRDTLHALKGALRRGVPHAAALHTALTTPFVDIPRTMDALVGAYSNGRAGKK